MVTGLSTSENEQGPALKAGRVRRAVRALGRHRLLTAAAVLIVAAGAVTAALALPGGYGDTVTGPFGAYPAPLPVTGQPRVLTHFYGRVVLAGGLAIVGDGNHVRAPLGGGTAAVTDGIAAVDLRTGRMYWSYRRPGHTVASVSAWPSGVYVLWDDGLLARISPRTAVIAWHHGTGAAGAGTEIWATGGSAARGTAVVTGNGEIDAVSEATGSPVWSAQPGGQCQFDQPVLTADTVVAVVHAADDGPSCAHRLRAYDLASGALRWQQPYPWLQPPTAVGAGTVLTGSSRLGTFDVIDARSGHQVRSISALPGPSPYDADGLVFVGAFGAQGTFGAWDAATGRLLWQHNVPPGEEGVSGPFPSSSGRAYVITVSAGAPIPDGLGDGKTIPAALMRLYGYDPRTGRRLSTTTLPVLNLAGGNAYDLAQMQAGTTVVPTASSGGVIALIETNAYETGFAAAGGSSVTSTWPTLVLAG